MAFVHSPFSFRFLDPFMDFNKLDVGFKQIGCRMSTSRMSDFTSRMSDFNKSDVYKSDFNKPYVGFLQVGCRILTSRMSDFYKSDVECRIFKVECRMAPISFRTNESQSRQSEAKCQLQAVGSFWNPTLNTLEVIRRFTWTFCFQSL